MSYNRATKGMNLPNTYHSFIIRIRQSENAEGQRAWTSEVEHFQSGDHHSFETLHGLLTFLCGHLDALEHLDGSDPTELET